MFALDGLDLAALVASRVCHDVISPVGAIVNGLEVLDETNQDEEMRTFALDLIRRSARQASARLQFCRLAFGAAGSAGAEIDTGDAETVARGVVDDDRTKLIWQVPRQLMPKNRVKLLLNLVVLAGNTIPRGGVIQVTQRWRRVPGAGRQAPIRACPPASATCWPAIPPTATSTAPRSSPSIPGCSPAPRASSVTVRPGAGGVAFNVASA